MARLQKSYVVVKKKLFNKISVNNFNIIDLINALAAYRKGDLKKSTKDSKVQRQQRTQSQASQCILKNR